MNIEWREIPASVIHDQWWAAVMAVKYAPCIRQLTCCSDQQEALARKAAELETSHKSAVVVGVGE